MIVLAFYKGKGDWVDWAIRLVTRSPYSHVEYVQDTTQMDDQGRHECWSSSARDGGVRCKQILLNDLNWELVPVLWQTHDLRVFFALKLGAKYDYIGILFSQLFAFHRQQKNRWFCSELIAAGLFFDASESFSPGSLKYAVEKLNKVFAQGMLERAQ